MKNVIPWIVYAGVFAMIAYTPVLAGELDRLPLGVPVAAACATVLCLLGALGAWAKEDEA